MFKGVSSPTTQPSSLELPERVLHEGFLIRGIMNNFGEVARIINRLFDLIDKAYGEYKRRERQKNIDKIKKDPNKAWSDKFGGGK